MYSQKLFTSGHAVNSLNSGMHLMLANLGLH